MRKLALAVSLFSLPALAAADPNTANRIVDAAYNHGEVVQIVAHLTDQIGGRLTNSPAMRKARACRGGPTASSTARAIPTKSA